MSKHSVNIISNNPVMAQLLKTLAKVLDTDFPILLIGETGVGKEVFADYIHYNSNRKNKAFVKVGLASLPHELLESELFGHTKGAYTNAIGEKKGLFEVANLGTIFLDDIDDFPFHMQSKLLRVLENKEIIKIGAEKPTKLDVRIIAATKKELFELVDKHQFRSDLLYRLNVIPVKIPPLRERKDDIPLLVKHFLNLCYHGTNIKVCNETFQALSYYDWPGNVRELKNLINRISLYVKDEITLSDIPKEILKPYPELNFEECTSCFTSKGHNLPEIISCLEYNIIKQTLNSVNGNKNAAAKLLNIKPSTFRDKLKKFNFFDHNSIKYLRRK